MTGFKPVARIVVAGLAVALHSFSASARTVYVNKNGAGPNHDGATWTRGFPTVQAGLNAATSGDEVWVAAATYGENITLKTGVALYGGFAGTETALEQRNWVANATILDGRGDTTLHVVSCAATVPALDGFTIRNGGRGVSVTAGAVAIANCTMSGNAWGVHVTASTATVTNCAVRSNTRGIYVYTSGAATVNRCVVETNTAIAIYVSGGSVAVSNSLLRACNGGVTTVSGAATVTNSTISGNVTGAYINGGSGIITNCIVGYNTTGIQANAASPPTLSHNDVFGNTTANYTGVTNPTGTNGNISSDPLFVNRPGNDFHLGPGSPCIDAGDSGAVTPGATDLGGEARIQGAQVDTGAYESKSLGFTAADAANALGAGGGLSSVSAADVTRLNVAPDSPGLDIRDALRIARKVAGLD